MSPPKEQDLKQIGIDKPLLLNGRLCILRNDKGLPTVFLFDEEHGNKNDCIDKNIANAKILIINANVSIIGVESLLGGKKWDLEKEDYCKEDYDLFEKRFAANWKNKCPRFADELSVNYKTFIYGVENLEMMEKISDEFQEGIRHPLHMARSKYFIRRLFEHYNENKLTGNLILNCGSNHNSDIIGWINNGQIDKVAGFKANYVQINSIEDN
jgi:hypothetical protein